MTRRILAALLFVGVLLGMAVASRAQTYLVVATCGALPLTPPVGAVGPVAIDQQGRLCTTAASSGTTAVNLTQVGGATVALGQTAMASAIPVVLPSNQSAIPVTVAAAPLQAVGLTPTDRTITSASGVSQTLMSANAARHSMTIVNTGNANCGVNPTGGTAAIAGAGTITIVPNGSYTPRVPTVSAVTVICTSGQPIYADEN